MRVQFHEQNVLFQILDHSAIMYQKNVSLELLVLKLVFIFFQLLFYFTFLFFHIIFSVSTCYKINWMEYPNEWARFRFVVQQVLISGNNVVLTKITNISIILFETVVADKLYIIKECALKECFWLIIITFFFMDTRKW